MPYTISLWQQMPLSRNFFIVPDDYSCGELLDCWRKNSWDAVLLRETEGYSYVIPERLDSTASSCADAAVRCPVIFAAEYQMMDMDQWLSQHGNTVIILGEDGEIAGVTSAVIIARTLLRDQHCLQSRFQSVLNILSEAVCVIDQEDRVAVWNKSSELLYGITAQEIVGQPIDQFFSNLMLTQVIKEKKEVKDKYHNPCQGKHVLINAAPVKLKDEIIGGVCSERDITEIVNLNQELTDASQKVHSLETTLDQLHTEADAFSGICGQTPAIKEAIQMARKVAGANVPLLLRGESGTGKELFAQAIHQASRRPGRFVAINCGAIPSNLFESELFGYESGAFTGADRKGKSGFFEMAEQGTLFLDEIGELPKELQVKLLRVLQEKVYYRIGGKTPLKIDVRIIAATHSDLEKMILANQFREDLYYRLNVVSLFLPSLRERREDIPELVYRGLQRYGQLHVQPIEKVEPSLMALFLEHPWPGNVRELYNVLERLVILAEGAVLTPENLPFDFTGTVIASTAGGDNTVAAVPGNFSEMGILEKRMIERVLEEEDYNKAAAAKRLAIPRSTLYY
ncbi:MAG TPA: sigma 54-interacting transcriptional regulator, partial [Patescibacteria group bacterium]|nr:sigma 54-interacting transcriptional regulator [Patescibacteria group bacterium]